MKNEIEKLESLADFLDGMAAVFRDRNSNDKLEESAKAIRKLSRNICSQGYVGCDGMPTRENCTSDHK